LATLVKPSEKSTCTDSLYISGREPMAREPDVDLLMAASGSLGIFLTRLLQQKLLLIFSIYQTTTPSVTPCKTRRCINSEKNVRR